MLAAKHLSWWRWVGYTLCTSHYPEHKKLNVVELCLSQLVHGLKYKQEEEAVKHLYLRWTLTGYWWTNMAMNQVSLKTSSCFKIEHGRQSFQFWSPRIESGTRKRKRLVLTFNSSFLVFLVSTGMKKYVTIRRNLMKMIFILVPVMMSQLCLEGTRVHPRHQLQKKGVWRIFFSCGWNGCQWSCNRCNLVPRYLFYIFWESKASGYRGMISYTWDGPLCYGSCA